MRFVVALVVALLAAGGCGSSPPQPSSTHVGPPSVPTLQVACDASPSLRCTAFLYGEGDVTAKASWSAAESFRLGMDVPVTPSSAVVLSEPGVPTVLQDANVYIRADYDSLQYGHVRNLAPHAYAVRPGGFAIPLAYVTGAVFAGAIPGSTFVGGATVEILDGEDAGRQQVTLEANGSYMIEFVHMNAPFTARASKTGYSSDVRRNSGIVDTQGYPSNNAMNFSISPR